jgi:hypothetical protein
MAIRPIYIDRNLIEDPVVTGLEIVPWRPVKDALALQLWPYIVDARHHATAQQTPQASTQAIHPDHGEHGPADFESQNESNPSTSVTKVYKRRQTNQKKTLALPSTVSSENPSTPLVQDNVRRSTRLSASRGGFREVRVDKEPSKKRKTVPILIEEATGQAKPIPLFMLQDWGIKCGVAPGELTEDALLKAPSPSVANDNE